MIQMIQEEYTNKKDSEHGQVIFNKVVQLTRCQFMSAIGFEKSVTIDWGDFTRHEWNKLSKDIEQITAKQIFLRNNFHPFILKEISHICFNHLEELCLSRNYIVSLQFLSRFQMPELKVLDISSNFITSTRSLVKAWLPKLQKLNIKRNFIQDIEPMFKGFFPRLLDFQINDIEQFSEKSIWKIKTPNKFRYQVYESPGIFLHGYWHPFERSSPKDKLTCVKYRQMISEKPVYFLLLEDSLQDRSKIKQVEHPILIKSEIHQL